MGLLTGKRILITGIASNRSIAYGIARSMYREGAELAFSYQSEKLKFRVKKFAASFNSKIVLPCNVVEDTSIKTLFTNLSSFWQFFDGFVHSIAFVPKNQLEGDYVNVITRDAFSIAHDISVYSFVAMAKFCRNMLNINSSLITMTYLGAERAIPNYNVMGVAKASLEANTRYMANSMGPQGIRVNAISAGPIRTIASSGIKNFKKILFHYESISPLRRLVTIDDIGNTAVFLCSDLSSGITGEIIHVDGGFSTSIMNKLELS